MTNRNEKIIGRQLLGAPLAVCCEVIDKQRVPLRVRQDHDEESDHK
jgi:hypothetical protein